MREIVQRHPGECGVVLDMFLDRLRELAAWIQALIITSKTRQADRDRFCTRYRFGELPTSVISRVGKSSVDLPDTRVVIQVSGRWGSRQEEVPRLGRVLRPKGHDHRVWSHTILPRESVEQKFAERRQRCLAHQRCRYTMETCDP